MPLPGLVDLVRSARPGADVANAYRRADERVFRFSRSAWAMAALARAVATSVGKTSADIWLPDYFCNQSSNPLRRTGATVRFYPITDVLEPDWDACRKMATDVPPDLFVLVHFYGKPAEGGRARAFCDDVGARLLEDAAHVLRPFDDIGTWGDAACYSPHKMFAVPDGSVMSVRAADLAGLIQGPGGGPAPSPVDWLARRMLQRLLPMGLRRARIAGTLSELAVDPTYVEMPDIPAPSRLGDRLLSLALDNLEAAAEARRANRRVLRELISRTFEAVPLIDDVSLPLYRDPWVFKDAGTAEGIYRSLRGRGLPVEGWPDLAPEVIAHPDHYMTAIRLRKTVITFPVHQTMTPADLRQIMT